MDNNETLSSTAHPDVSQMSIPSESYAKMQLPSARTKRMLHFEQDYNKTGKALAESQWALAEERLSATKESHKRKRIRNLTEAKLVTDKGSHT